MQAHGPHMKVAVLQSTTTINVLCAMQGQQSNLGHNCPSGSGRRQDAWSGQPEGLIPNRAEPASWEMQLGGAQMGHGNQNSGLHAI